MSVKKSLPIRIGDVTKDNFNMLRKINQAVFPLTYSESWYQSILEPEVKPITKLAWHNDVVVGGISCRFELVPPPANDAHSASAELAVSLQQRKALKQIDAQGHTELWRIYIMTLGVLAPYRGRGIGQQLLRQITEYAESHADIVEVYLHVHTINKEGLEFYKKQGFENVGKLEGYYKKLDPSDAFIVSKKFIHPGVIGANLD